MKHVIINEICELHEMLVNYYDDSELSPAIEQDDVRHRIICGYRKSLPGGHLPPGEGSLMRRLLRLSRSDDLAQREESKRAAEEWTALLEKKYSWLCNDELPGSNEHQQQDTPLVEVKGIAFVYSGSVIIIDDDGRMIGGQFLSNATRHAVDEAIYKALAPHDGKYVRVAFYLCR